MTYYLFDSKGFVGDLASIHGLFELREFLSSRDTLFSDFFDKGYTEEIARFGEALSGIASDDEAISETLHSLGEILPKCKDLAIISDGYETEEDAGRKKEIKKRYTLQKGKRPDPAMRRQRARELYKPQGRRAQDFVHEKLVEFAGEMGAEMTRGNHPFDLIIGENAIDFIVLAPDKLDEDEDRNAKRR